MASDNAAPVASRIHHKKHWTFSISFPFDNPFLYAFLKFSTVPKIQTKNYSISVVAKPSLRPLHPPPK